MARQQGSGKVYKRADKGSDWWLDYTDAHGKRRRRKGGRTKKEAEQTLSKLIQERDAIKSGNVTALRQQGQTLGELRERFLQAHALHKTEQRLERLDRFLRRIEASLPTTVVDQLSNQDILSVFGRFKHQEGLANGTINHHIVAFNTLVKWAKLSRFETVSILDTGKKNQRRPQRSITKEELTRLIEVCEAHAMNEGTELADTRAAKILFLADTGCRFSEAGRLTWDELDLDGGTAFFPGSTNKIGLERTVPLTPRLQARLRLVERRSPLVLPLANGGPELNSFTFNRWLKQRLPEAGIPLRTSQGIFSAHGLRHTFATRLALAGVPIQKAMYLTGHESLTTLTRIYTHIRAQDVEGLLAEPTF